MENRSSAVAAVLGFRERSPKRPFNRYFSYDDSSYPTNYFVDKFGAAKLVNPVSVRSNRLHEEHPVTLTRNAVTIRNVTPLTITAV